MDKHECLLWSCLASSRRVEFPDQTIRCGPQLIFLYRYNLVNHWEPLKGTSRVVPQKDARKPKEETRPYPPTTGPVALTG